MRGHVSSLIVPAAIAAVLAVAVLDAVRPSEPLVEASSPLAPSATARSATTTTTTREADLGDACSTQLECWARDVALGAGYRIVANTGSAWVLRRGHDSGRRSFYFWLTRAHSPPRNEGYRLVGRLGESRVFRESVRFTWRVRGRTAWAQAAGDEPLTLRQLNLLIATSTNWPLDAAP